MIRQGRLHGIRLEDPNGSVTFPKLHDSVFTAPSADIIGDVEIGEQSSVWFNTVLRGDVMPIRIGSRTNIQDGSVIHGTFKKAAATIGSNVSVGHSVILHGCTIEDFVLVGMQTTIMDGVVVEKDCFIGAGSLLTEGKRFASGSMIMGRPAKVVREITPEEHAFLRKSAQNYINYQNWYVNMQTRRHDELSSL